MALDCELAVVFLSQDYAGSFNCKREMGALGQLKKRVLFVEVDPDFDVRCRRRG